MAGYAAYDDLKQMVLEVGPPHDMEMLDKAYHLAERLTTASSAAPVNLILATRCMWPCCWWIWAWIPKAWPPP